MFNPNRVRSRNAVTRNAAKAKTAIPPMPM